MGDDRNSEGFLTSKDCFIPTSYKGVRKPYVHLELFGKWGSGWVEELHWSTENSCSEFIFLL